MVEHRLDRWVFGNPILFINEDTTPGATHVTTRISKTPRHLRMFNGVDAVRVLLAPGSLGNAATVQEITPDALDPDVELSWAQTKVETCLKRSKQSIIIRYPGWETLSDSCGDPAVS